MSLSFLCLSLLSFDIFIKQYFIDIPLTKQIQCIYCHAFLNRRHTTENMKHLVIYCHEFIKQQPIYHSQLTCHLLTCESSWRTIPEQCSWLSSNSYPITTTTSLSNAQHIPCDIHQLIFPQSLQQSQNIFQGFNQQIFPSRFEQIQSQSQQILGNNNQESDENNEESNEENNINQQNLSFNQTIPLKLPQQQQQIIPLHLNHFQPQEIIINIQESDLTTHHHLNHHNSNHQQINSWEIKYSF